jgi:hypothetical protein
MMPGSLDSPTFLDHGIMPVVFASALTAGSVTVQGWAWWMLVSLDGSFDNSLGAVPARVRLQVSQGSSVIYSQTQCQQIPNGSACSSTFGYQMGSIVTDGSDGRQDGLRYCPVWGPGAIHLDFIGGDAATVFEAGWTALVVGAIYRNVSK